MSKRTVFSNITPLPPSISRATALRFLHDHAQMIDLNPLVIERHEIPPPAHAEPEERACVWFSITDRIAYVPGLVEKPVSYTAAFHDLPNGLQTHSYAPMGLDIRGRWTVGGNAEGEPREPVEIGIGAPETGLYLREDVVMRCNFLLAGFVKKTVQKGHAKLVATLTDKAQKIGPPQSNHRLTASTSDLPSGNMQQNQGPPAYYASSQNWNGGGHSQGRSSNRSQNLSVDDALVSSSRPYDYIGHYRDGPASQHRVSEGDAEGGKWYAAQRYPPPPQQQPPPIPIQSRGGSNSRLFPELE